MKTLLFTSLFIFSLSIAARADSWALPTTETYCSENGKFCLKVEPKKLQSQLSYFEDKVNGKEDAGADKSVRENYCKGTFSSSGRKLWKVRLDNEVSPVSALISNDGKHVITFDNWHEVGYGDNVVSIYSGVNGKLTRKMGLSDFLTESDINHLPASVSSIHWHGTHKIDYRNNQLVLQVVKNSSKGEFFSVHVNLINGSILDPVVDRLPSLQFIFSIKEPDDGMTDYSSNNETNPCNSPDGAVEVSERSLFDRIVRKEMPAYPAAAQAVRATGISVFEILISPAGSVECVSPLSGHPLLRAVLINSLKKWQFEKSQNSYRGKIRIEGKSTLVMNGKVVE